MNGFRSFIAATSWFFAGGAAFTWGVANRPDIAGFLTIVAASAWAVYFVWWLSYGRGGPDV